MKQGQNVYITRNPGYTRAYCVCKVVLDSVLPELYAYFLEPNWSAHLQLCKFKLEAERWVQENYWCRDNGAVESCNFSLSLHSVHQKQNTGRFANSTKDTYKRCDSRKRNRAMHLVSLLNVDFAEKNRTTKCVHRWF